jgi:hypothetical protein
MAKLQRRPAMPGSVQAGKRQLKASEGPFRPENDKSSAKHRPGLTERPLDLARDDALWRIRLLRRFTPRNDAVF